MKINKYKCCFLACSNNHRVATMVLFPYIKENGIHKLRPRLITKYFLRLCLIAKYYINQSIKNYNNFTYRYEISWFYHNRVF